MFAWLVEDPQALVSRPHVSSSKQMAQRLLRRFLRQKVAGLDRAAAIAGIR
jgi:hypothetical protein